MPDEFVWRSKKDLMNIVSESVVIAQREFGADPYAENCMHLRFSTLEHFENLLKEEPRPKKPQNMLTRLGYLRKIKFKS